MWLISAGTGALSFLLCHPRALWVAEVFLTWRLPLLHLSLLLPKFPAWPPQIEQRFKQGLEGEKATLAP